MVRARAYLEQERQRHRARVTERVVTEIQLRQVLNVRVENRLNHGNHFDVRQPVAKQRDRVARQADASVPRLIHRRKNLRDHRTSVDIVFLVYIRATWSDVMPTPVSYARVPTLHLSS